MCIKIYRERKKNKEERTDIEGMGEIEAKETGEKGETAKR